MLKIFFFGLDCLTISYLSSYVKNHFFGPSRGVPHLALFFFSCLFFHFFIFVFFFNFFPCFSFFFVFPLSIFYSFIFLLFFFSRKCFFFFHFVSLFCFLGFSKSLAALQDSLWKSAHSELALFALYWLVVTFPCGVVHFLVMIRLRVVFGGRRVVQVLPSYQNGQIRLTHLSLVSSLFCLLSSSLISISVP